MTRLRAFLPTCPRGARAAITALALAGGLTMGLAPATPVGATSCTGTPATILSLSSEMSIGGTYALPASSPTAMVVFGHGYRNDSSSWAGHLTEAAQHGLLAVAPDYTGLGAGPDFRGWPAQAGANDVVAAAQHFLASCSTITKVEVLGVSMGGNMTGLAVAAKATRADGVTPLFDYWVDVEGATNWIETWAEATAVGPGNAYAAGAAADIQAEAGGTPLTAPAAFASRDVLLRHADVAGSGIKGVVMIHSVEDGLVPYDQSRELATALRLDGRKVDVYSVLRRTGDRDPGHDQTTLTSDASATLGDMDPFSGHAWEGSSTHIVMKTAMAQLFALVDGTEPAPDNQEFVVDSGLGTVGPLPL